MGLMLPTNTDPFVPDDFDATFGILDSKPGFTLVPNYGALPTNLTAAQHGSPYLQLDNGAAWYWYRPSNGAPGVWKRLNDLGVLGTITGGAVQTTSQVLASGPTLCSVTVTSPGGRWLRFVYDGAISATNGLGQVNFWFNGGAFESHLFVTNKANHMGKQFVGDIPPQAPGTAVTIRASLNAAAVPTTYGGGGTIHCALSKLTISEL